MSKEAERFYRKSKDRKQDKMTEFGNARPQNTVYSKLDDEELGSLLLFKVPRHCRNHSVMEDTTVNSNNMF